MAGKRDGYAEQTCGIAALGQRLCVYGAGTPLPILNANGLPSDAGNFRTKCSSGVAVGFRRTLHSTAQSAVWFVVTRPTRTRPIARAAMLRANTMTSFARQSRTRSGKSW